MLSLLLYVVDDLVCGWLDLCALGVIIVRQTQNDIRGKKNKKNIENENCNFQIETKTTTTSVCHFEVNKKQTKNCDN